MQNLFLKNAIEEILSIVFKGGLMLLPEIKTDDTKSAEQNELIDFKKRMMEEEERINSGIKNIRNSHDEMLQHLQYNIKRIDSYLSNSNLSKEDKEFFSNQMDLFKTMQKAENDKFDEIEGELRKQKEELNDKLEQEQEKE